MGKIWIDEVIATLTLRTCYFKKEYFPLMYSGKTIFRLVTNILTQPLAVDQGGLQEGGKFGNQTKNTLPCVLVKKNSPTLT